MNQTRVTEQAVHELLARIPWSSFKKRQVFETVACIVPDLETGDEQAALSAAVEIIKMRDDYRPDAWSDDLIRLEILQCIRELDNHVDKATVVGAALAKLSDVQAKEKYLFKMQRQLRAIFQNLDARTKAILEIRSELSCVDGVTNPPTDYCNILDNFDSVDVSILRSEPELAPLLEAYSMARSVNETL